MKPPSTGWRETIGVAEDQRFQNYAEQLVEIQRRGHAKHGPGRALHRKQHLGLRASFEVLGDLPAHASHGLFAKPGRYDAHLRMSNGSGERGADKKPDVRGFGIRVLAVEGAGALGAPATAQCFVLINSPTFAFPTVEDFMGVVVAVSHGPVPLLRHLVKRHGVFGGVRHARRLAAGLGKPFPGFACETFHSAAAVACGPYAAKVRLVPAQSGEPPPARPSDWASDVIARITKAELRWDLQLQFFVDEAITPIENPTVAWSEAEAPFVTVARLAAPQTGSAGRRGRKARRRDRGGQVRSVGRARRPSPARRDHARAQGGILRESKGARRGLASIGSSCFRAPWRSTRPCSVDRWLRRHDHRGRRSGRVPPRCRRR